MLLNFIISAFKMEEDTKESKNMYPHASSSNKGTVIVGLKILIQISQGKSNIVEKPAALGSTRSAASDQYSCYLKACHLCNKKLSLDKDIFMYRGDIGFCSVECRERQIYLDEVKELEVSTMKILKSNNYRHYYNNGGAHRSETRILVEELRQERHHNKTTNYQKMHWAIIS